MWPKQYEGLPTKKCKRCGKPFVPANQNQLYCPPPEGKRKSRCKGATGNERHRGRPQGTLSEEPYACAQCGKRCIRGENVAAHASKFCGSECKAAWHGKANEYEKAVAILLTPHLQRGPRPDEWRKILRADPCAYCGKGELETAVDHVEPKADGGDDDWTNMVGACRHCNNTKGRSPLLLFLGWRSAFALWEPYRAAVAKLHTYSAH